MIEYNVFWKEYFIGKLFINEEKKCLFEENKEEIEKATSEGMLYYLLPKNTSGFTNIPFFENRIKANHQNLDVIKYNTDGFELHKIK